MKWLFRRWQLKLLAVVMAIALYLFTGSQITIERTVTLQINEQDLVGLPGNYLVSRLSPQEIDVTISGPRSVVEDFNPESIEPELVIGTDGLTAGFQEFDLTERLLSLNPSLSMRSSSTDSIRADFSRLIEDVLPLARIPAPSGLPDGLRAELSLVRSQVLLRGPADEIARLKADGPLEVRPIDLSQVPVELEETLEMTIPLLLSIPDVAISIAEQPQAVVRITPALESEVVGPLPVRVLGNADVLERYEIEIVPPVVALTISGPANRLAEGNAAALIKVYVDVVDVGRGGVGEERSVRIIAPSWMTTTTTAVVVTLRPRGEEGEAPTPDIDTVIPPVEPIEQQPLPPAPPEG